MQHYTSISRWTLHHLHNIFDRSWNCRFQIERNFCFETKICIPHISYICICLEFKVVELNLLSIVNRRWTVLKFPNSSIVSIRQKIMDFVFNICKIDVLVEFKLSLGCRDGEGDICDILDDVYFRHFHLLWNKKQEHLIYRSSR